MFDDAIDDVLTRRRQKRNQDAYYWNPVLWAEERAGLFLWSKQREIAHSVVDNHDVAVKAGHGVGKSLLAAVLICWWMDTRWPDGRVASTAPSAHQIGAIVWFEVRNIFKAVQKRYDAKLTYAPLPGYITSDNEWKDDSGQKIGFGRKPPDHKTDDAFQGIHARKGGVLSVGDEAVGLQEDMIDALGNITSTEESRRFLICNPTNPASHVGKLFKDKPSNWTFHTISVFDNPNFTGEEVPEEVAKALSDQSYVDSKKAEYGEGTPRYISRVEGEFAFDSDFSLITEEDMAKGHDLDIEPTGQRPILGVDVARFGNDYSVIYSNDGGKVRFVDSWNKTDGMTTAQRIHDTAMSMLASEVRIDSTGLGGPILDRVAQIRNEAEADYDIVAMVGSERSPDRTQHHNARAWWYDRFRYGLRDGHLDLDPKDEKLKDELMGIEYKFAAASNGLLIESKDDMRKRGLKSPDYADAAIYAAADMAYIDGPQPGKTSIPVEEIDDLGYGDPVLDAIDAGFRSSW
jgi:hypothetical protein